MSGFASGLTEDSLKVPEKLIFQPNEIVKMQCLDFYDNTTDNSLKIRCKVLSGPHADKQTSIFLNSKDNAASQKVKIQFLRAFWSDDEILGRNGKELKLARLVGRIFTVKSHHGENKKNAAQPFQNWQEFTDLGTGDPQGTSAQGGQIGAAPTQMASPAAQSAAQIAAGQASF